MIVAHQASHERDIREAVTALISRRCFDAVELIKLRHSLESLRLLSHRATDEWVRVATDRSSHEIRIRGGHIVTVRHRLNAKVRTRELAA